MRHKFFTVLLTCTLSTTVLYAQEPLPPTEQTLKAPSEPDQRALVELKKWDDLKKPPTPCPYASFDADEIETEIDRVLQEYCDTLEAEDRRVDEKFTTYLRQIRTAFFTGRDELLREKLRRETDPAKKEFLGKQIRQTLDDRVENLDKLRSRRRGDFLAGTTTMDYYLDAEKRWKKARIEQVIAEADERDENLAEKVYEVLSDFQMRIASFRGEKEEQYLLGKLGMKMWTLYLRLALYEARDETDHWLQRHPELWENRRIVIPADADHSKLPYQAMTRSPKDVLKIRIDKNRADILRTADELVTATKASWNIGVCTMTEPVNAVLYRNEARLAELKSETESGQRKKRMLELFDADIEAAEKMVRQMSHMFTTNPRTRLYYLQARLLLRTLEHRRACQLLELATDENEKREAQDEFRTTSDKVLQDAEFVTEEAKRNFLVGIARQKGWLDAMEYLKSARLERLHFEKKIQSFRVAPPKEP